MSKKPIWEIAFELFKDVSEEEWNEFKTAFRERRECFRCKELQDRVCRLEADIKSGKFCYDEIIKTNNRIIKINNRLQARIRVLEIGLEEMASWGDKKMSILHDAVKWGEAVMQECRRLLGGEIHIPL